MPGMDKEGARTGRRLMRLLVAATSLMLFACAADESEETAAAPPAADRGESLFMQNCGVCHGPEGRGPALAGIKALSSDELRDRIRNHPVAGQIPQRLPANELSDVIEYLEAD